MESLSIIVPVYNGEMFVKETLESILNQSYQNFELLVVDDGSSDKTKDVVLSLNDHRAKFIELKHDGAPGHCRNYGIDNALGEYIIFFDSDDIMYPKMLETLMANVASNKVDLVICNCDYFNVVSKQKTKNEMQAFFDKKEHTYNDLFTINPFPCTKMYKLAFLKDTKVRYLEGLFNQDLGFFLSFVMHQPQFMVIEDILLQYRIRPNSITTSPLTRKKHMDILKVFDQVFETYEKNPRPELFTYGLNEMFIKTMMYKAGFFNPLTEKQEIKAIRTYLYKKAPLWYNKIEFKNFYSTKKKLYNRLLMQYQLYDLIGMYKKFKNRVR